MTFFQVLFCDRRYWNDWPGVMSLLVESGARVTVEFR